MPTVLTRVLVVGGLILAATAGITLAAGKSLNSSASPAGTTPLVQAKATLVVPDVRRQAFVFAKGVLQEAGFAWRVVGGVRGYAANTVLTQTPTPGVRVKDTGAPLVKLTLARNAKYPQEGVPEDVSPYHATALVISDARGAALAPLPATTTPTATTPTTTAPTTSAPTTAPAATTTATTTTAPTATTQTTSTYPERSSSPAKAPTSTPPASKPTSHAAAAAPAKAQYPQSRPPAFVAPGAPSEPLDEMPLPDRARLLGRWLAGHPKPTDANVRHWLYQNEWIVAGAKFGWWRGAEALRLLVAVDRQTVAFWGIGTKSQAVAARALAAVEAKSR